MFHTPRVSRLLVFVALLALSAVVLTACTDGALDENAVVLEEPNGASEIDVEDVEEPSVEEAVEAREEGEPPGEVFGTVEPVGEAAVEGIDEQVEAQIDALGERVTLAGTITEMVGDRTFVLASTVDTSAPDEDAAESEPILVIFVGDALPSLDDSAESMVTLSGAVVAAFYIEDVEKATGLDLDDDQLDTYEGGPALIATSVALSD